MKHLFRLLLITVLLSFQFAFAGELQVAQIDGTNTNTQLYFTPKMLAMLELFKTWEQRLAKNEIDATFYLASGDFRRAILDLDVEGPGDVEILIHINNQNLKPLTIPRLLDFLKTNGVDVKPELHQIFGDEKKLDIFAKDRFSLDHDRPYVGELGLFEGMGDTSINQLRYSPSKNKVEGDRANLDALKEGRILFLEKDKTAQLPEAKKITGLKSSTIYKSTILRLALRSIRLETEILLSPNPNDLTLDSSFDDVLKGFELFFAEALEKNSHKELKEFKFDEAYVEQFLKIFRGRTREERKIIRTFLEKKFPETLKLWLALGLNYKTLVNTGNERAAIAGNARYSEIRPFLDKKHEVQNPFEPPRIPVQVLSDFSARLEYLVRNYDSLKFEEQVTILNQYNAAVAYLEKPAISRLKQRTFIDIHLANLSYLDPSALEEDDERSLQELMLETKRPLKRTYREAKIPESEKAFQEILKKVKASKAAGQVPVVVLDLDGVLFMGLSSRLEILKRYDRDNGTDYFKDLTLTDLQERDVKDLVYLAVQKKIEEPKKAIATADQILDFFMSLLSSEVYYHHLELNTDLVNRLQPIFAAGAVPFYLTARSPYLTKLTQKALLEAGLPKGELVMMQERGHVSEYKLQELKKYKEANSSSKKPHELISFFDDNRGTVVAIQKGLPEIASYRVLTRRNASSWEAFLAEKDGLEHRVLGTRSADACESKLKKKTKRKKASTH